MIKADKANLEIRGCGEDVIFELNHIFDMFIKCNPEIIIAVSALWAEKMMERDREDYDDSIINFVTKLTHNYIMGSEEEHDNE